MYLPTNTLLQEGKYRIIEKIGQGGFGIAYKAYHQLLNKTVCIKEFFYTDLCERKIDSLDVTIVSTSSDKILLVNSFKKKFVKEAQRLATFQHPNIVQIMDVFVENNTAYFVMEYLEGGSLEDKLKNEILTEKQTLDIILPVLDALGTVHKAKLLHLDIKPLNIMFRKDKTPVLIDFGISKYIAVAVGYTTTAPVGLSKGYAPLEQYGGDIADFSEATDIYSVCATMYRMVTGITPPEPLQILANGIEFPYNLQPQLSAEFNNIIIKGMSIKAADRPQNIIELHSQLLKDNPKNETVVKKQSATVVNGPNKKMSSKFNSVLVFVSIIVLITFSIKFLSRNGSGSNNESSYLPTSQSTADSIATSPITNNQNNEINDSIEIKTNNKIQPTMSAENEIDIKKQIVNEIPTQKSEKSLIGKHLLSGYAIGWDENFGTIEFYKKRGKIYCIGEHCSKKYSDEYLKIKGEVEILSPTKFSIDGEITTKYHEAEIGVGNGIFVFNRTSNSSYWRLSPKYLDPVKQSCPDIDIFTRLEK